ncbi:MAG: hypothetical protein H6668_01345 [Ardenticatenaceae bacterium]|nr:hypothetical protein [Ardenticatenaceae bacterium]
MKSNAQKIFEFHEAIGSPLPKRPLIPPPAAAIQLRQTLIDEEYAEVTAAFQAIQTAQANGDIIDAAPLMHELADLLYVVYGAMWAFGIDPDPIFAEVHRANMQKAGGPRRADGKLLKPPDWQPANVAGVIARLQDGTDSD